MNIFDKMILEGTISSLPELRRYYRALVSKTHPDTARTEDSHESFIRLKSDFEQAKSRLARMDASADRGHKPSKPTREEIYHSFWDIEASGFPVDRSVRESSRLYRERIRSFSRQLGAYWARPNPSFEEIENELYELDGRNLQAAKAFLSWLVDDMKNGAAL